MTSAKTGRDAHGTATIQWPMNNSQSSLCCAEGIVKLDLPHGQAWIGSKKICFCFFAARGPNGPQTGPNGPQNKLGPKRAPNGPQIMNPQQAPGPGSCIGPWTVGPNLNWGPFGTVLGAHLFILWGQFGHGTARNFWHRNFRILHKAHGTWILQRAHGT